MLDIDPLVNPRPAPAAGAGGLGLAFARGLLSTGMASGVALLDLTGADASAAALAKEFSADVIAFEVDVTDTPALEAAFDATVAHFGRLTLVANNAVSAAPPHPHHTLQHIVYGSCAQGIVMPEFAKFKLVCDVNLTAVVAGTRKAYEVMSASGREDGVIINIASLAALVPMPFNPVYGATKAGVKHLSRSCAYMAQGGGAGAAGSGKARVYALCPGFTDTNMVRSGLAAQDAGLTMAVGMQGSVMTAEYVTDCFLELVANGELESGGHMVVTPEGVMFGRRAVEVPERVSKGGDRLMSVEGKL